MKGEKDMGWGEIIGGIILGGAALAVGVVGAVAAGVGLILLVKITYDAIVNYLDRAKKIAGAETCELVKDMLANGKYSVVANVFDSSHEKLETQKWEGQEIDAELESAFGQRNKIICDLRS
jgi:hypothetical protein